MSAQQLDVIDLPLAGRHLIEASAGTGKTFNITRIYLRCLLEQKLTVQQILVMTFTKAATEEIRGRIAATLREALVYWHARREGQQAKSDPVLNAVYDRLDPDEAEALLQAALLELDDASVFTIHSFCNNVLADLAFTSAAPLELALATDTKALYLQGCEDFIRKISQDDAAFALLAECGWHTPDALLSEFYSLFEFADRPELASTETIEQQFDQLLVRLAERYKPQADGIYTTLVDNEALFMSALIGKDAERAREWQVILDWLFNGPLYEVPEELGKFVNGNRYRAKREGIEQAKAIVEPVKDLRKSLNEEVADVFSKKQALLARLPVYTVVCNAVDFVRDYVKKQKQRLNTVDFNDLIRLLAAQIDSADSPLCQQLRQRYPVALVDEFQDTDADQYHILANVYAAQNEDESPQTTLLMIGDPKQAIYGFRGGDIFTYLQAARQARYRWVMDTNWRSVKPMVEAYNRLFWGAPVSEPARDVFRFGIGYEPVKASDGAKAAAIPLVDSANDRAALTFIADEPLEDDSKAKGATRLRLAKQLTNEILRLLAQATLGDRAVLPADIAILVQTGTEADIVQSALKAVGLPSVYLSNRNSLFASSEAADLLMVLNAIWHAHDLRLVNSVVASPLLGLSREQIHTLLTDEYASDWDRLLMQIAQLREIWTRQGVMALILGMLQNSYMPRGGDAERSLTNYQHLGEVLEEAARTYTQPGHLLNWLHRQVRQPEQSQEHIQRLESDARLIQIVTQHGSKGLEYPIVFVPFASEYRDPLSFGGRQSQVLRFYDSETASQRMALGAPPAIQARVKSEGDAESMRLLYVAITRASHRCYLGVAESKLSEQSALGTLVRREAFNDWQEAVQAIVSEGAGHTAMLTHIDEVPLTLAQEQAAELSCQTFQRPLDDNWRLYSFSALTRQVAHTSFRQREAESFSDGPSVAVAPVSSPALRFALKAGAQSGNLLHDLLEVTDFSAPDWQENGVAIAKRYGIEETSHNALFEWLEEVLQTPLVLEPDGEACLQLADLPLSDTLREAEFYFPLQSANRRAVGRVLQAHRDSLAIEALPVALDGVQLDGMMHGFIDLIFCHQGRYFVADYKSTFLGDKPGDYHPHKLCLNNQQHYYDLQYLIYSVALHRFLAQRIEDYDPDSHFGGVAYFYLRGMSPDFPPGSGVFFDPLSTALIEQMEQALTAKVTEGAQ
ncbi:exodeoxyribonuclease V subunit beta [Alteromonas lipolytica]|uniref:RecBCD enzyme subunit RecB n=1 Tax=Alteromonas lipolytica TaxID=1856405 RepID=A0A1E8FG11_9ALTE|nr:exodeoxyribonuclease V subunit beta [Alteromonas lipolytica]OFI34882.1 exodeoxyribonuclease V subunit beta [Alteromonas lipolytica]GGF54810.1 RecBCD enzyme subunit RecB [Alteromonas lipolytica]